MDSDQLAQMSADWRRNAQRWRKMRNPDAYAHCMALSTAAREVGMETLLRENDALVERAKERRRNRFNGRRKR